MKRIAKFDKVSFEQFCKNFNDNASVDEVRAAYNTVTIPTRSTSGSAGYDYVCPMNVTLNPGEDIVIPTGIRASMKKNYVHMICPRSGMGFKYRIRLNNTLGIIDSDYYHSDNEGHIMIKLSNEGNKSIEINAGDKFAQGIFFEYGITVDDDVTASRNGGMGSTGK